jgi:hypothetical protein
MIGCSRGCHAYVATKGYSNYIGSGLFSVIATSEFYTSAFFMTPDYDFPHYVSLVLAGEAPYDDITFDGESLADQNWETADGFSYMWMEVTKGRHLLQSEEDRGFAAYVYGHSLSWAGGYVYNVFSGKTE